MNDNRFVTLNFGFTERRPAKPEQGTATKFSTLSGHHYSSSIVKIENVGKVDSRRDHKFDRHSSLGRPNFSSDRKQGGTQDA